MIWLLWIPVTLAAPSVFPLVDPGLFVISGVKTCGGGGGYCLLGLDCTLDEDFLPDDSAGQHCEGLRSAFTPSAHFVCCRATNRSVYQPPMVLAAVDTEPVTSRTTTLDVLGNEIDQVLLKVAESVDAVKKAPVTEPTQAQTDIIELRESIEDSSEEEEQMLADSPDTNLSSDSDETSEEDSTESQSSEELEPLKTDSQSFNTENTPITEVKKTVEGNTIKLESSTGETNKGANQVTSTLNSENKKIQNEEEEYLQNHTISNKTVLTVPIPNVSIIRTSDVSNTSNETRMPELEITNGTAVMTDKSNGNRLNIPHKNVSKLEADNNTVLSNEETTDAVTSQTNIEGAEIKSDSENAIAYPTAEGDSPENDSLSKENLSQNHILPGKPIKTLEKGIETLDDDAFTSGTEDLSSVTTQIPNLTVDQVTKKIVTNDNAEWFHAKLNETKIKKKPNLEISNNQEVPINQIPTKPLAEDLPNNVEVYNSNTTGSNKSSKDEATNTVSNMIPQTKNSTVGDQLVTSTTVSPDTQTMNNGVTQGQVGVDAPCSRTSGENCTTEVKFVFENQTLCLGSVYSVDWIVTSASCALRIFRIGMVNVSITPLSGSQRVSVRTIVVHESYGEAAANSGQEVAPNNIGLVQMRETQTQWAPCVPCLVVPGAPDTSMTNCSAINNIPSSQNCTDSGQCVSSRSAEGRPTGCHGPARSLIDDHGLTYLTLACDTLWNPRTDLGPHSSGAPLLCKGVLTGVEGSAGVGLRVYTPLAPYLSWLARNTGPEPLPEQQFNLG